MAKKNRIEILAEVVTKFVATLTLTTHKSFLDDDLINSAVYEKDVIASQSPAGGNITIDYADKDTATVVITANLAVSFTNLENGAVKYLHITKNAGNTISFAGATDVSARQDFIDITATVVIYEVFNKNSVVSVNSINIDNDIGVILIDPTPWILLTLINGWIGVVKIRLNQSNHVEIITENLRVASKTDDAFAVMPVAQRTSYDWSSVFLGSSSLLDAVHYENTGSFELKTSNPGGSVFANFYVDIPKDLP